MRPLFFHATTRRPSTTLAVMGQVAATLRPFKQFLGQAIHTAKQRQVRYRLPWERVRDLRPIRLVAQDTLVRVPRRPPGALITNWPAGAGEGKAPDLTQQGFVINRGVPVRIEAAAPAAGGLRVRTDPVLQPGDRLLFCELVCEVTLETAPMPPREVADAGGAPLRLVTEPRDDGDGHWRLVIEGDVVDGDLVVDGERVEAEALPMGEALGQVTDGIGRSFAVRDGMLRVTELPAEGLLRGDNGVRYRWNEADEGSGARRGSWIQLLLPEASEASETDDFLDPRAAFCEGEVKQVWTQARFDKDTSFEVKRVDPDRYQLLLDRLPAEGTTLFLPVDVRSLYLQKRALRQLAEAPLPHHQGLLRLCEDPSRVSWPEVAPARPETIEWRSLVDDTRSGTPEQRAFVHKALGSPDFAFLQGPPGSGKTTAICEIIQQLVERGQRVLLCASTHVAIDNVLERLLASTSPIDAVRIGKLDKVDDRVAATQLDTRVEALVRAWRDRPVLRAMGEGELREMAVRTVIMSANLTCGTTMGIVSHPLFDGRDENLHIAERPISTMPHWDVLIVDEASKTLIQEFMVPALMARRWIIVGDVRQLPPFADRADIVANLRDLVDDNDRPLFPRDHQRACLLRFRLLRPDVRQPGMRWLLVEPPVVLDRMAEELETRRIPDLAVVRIIARGGGVRGGASDAVRLITAAQLRAGAPEALAVAAADWVLVGTDLAGDVSGLLPSNLLVATGGTGGAGALPEGDPFRLRQAFWLGKPRPLHRSYVERKHRRDAIATMTDSQACEADWLRRSDLAQELAWRLTRLHELRYGRDESERSRLRREIVQLKPAAVDISDPLAEIEDIGLPSILEVLQEGIGVERTLRPSALTDGLRTCCPAVFAARFESLTWQHRMHPDISAFSRELIYGGQALRDANTIGQRDATIGWDFDFGQLDRRRVWVHVPGREHNGENLDEVRLCDAILRDLIAWARRKGPPARKNQARWEVACLCFYTKQERALSNMLRALSGDDRRTRFSISDAPVEIVCGTVDRFQGREADLVLLSMRNTGRTGFLDSPNRLNVGVTRARQQLIVVGNAEYFDRCRIPELQELVRRSPRVDIRQLRGRRQASR